MKRQRVLQDQDDAVLREGQEDDIFVGAARDSLSKCDEHAMSAQEVLDLLMQICRPDVQDEEDPQNNGNAAEEDAVDYSELADEEADAALENEMASVVSSNRAIYGAHAEDKPVAKAKSKPASKLLAFRDRGKGQTPSSTEQQIVNKKRSTHRC